jgi:[acyl-carrier-protein] S-malonyltransferase
MKRAALFPGQGSQSVGMGRDLVEVNPKARVVFDEADRVLGFSVSRMCFDGPEEELKKTSNTQPAILAVSIAVLRVMQDSGFEFSGVAGHSLGTYSALVAAQVLKFEDALRLVRRRGELMEQTGAGRGTMAAILGLSEDGVHEACRRAGASGVVEPANVNGPGQIVISGEKAAVASACVIAKELGAKRVLELSVSGPFHSSLMEPAVSVFAKELAGVSFAPPAVDFYSDVDARVLRGTEEIRDYLARQLVRPVQWTRLIEAMNREGFGDYVEVGPGRVLAGLTSKIARESLVTSVGDLKTLASFQTSRG